MTTINLGGASWTLAKDKLHLEVAAFASLGAHGLLDDEENLLNKDVWIDKGNKFHFSFHISFNGLPLDSGAPNGDIVPGFVASALTQAPVGHIRSYTPRLLTPTFQFWSQLRLAPFAPLLDHTPESCPCNRRSLTLNLEHDRGSDVDLSNVKPPNGIPTVSLDSVQISLTFSQIPTPLERYHSRSEEASPSFEDLLCPENSLQTPELDLNIHDWWHEEDKGPDDHEAILDLLHSRPVTLLGVTNDPLKSPSSYRPTTSGPFCLPGSGFQSLETRNLIFSRQHSDSLHQHDEDMVFSDEHLSLRTNKLETSAISSSVSTFKSLEPERSSSVRTAGKGTVCTRIPPTFHAPLPIPDTIALYQPILGLTDVALRTLIHPQPTRISAGIKFSGTDSAYDSYPSQDKPKPTALSELAPSIFTPEFAQGVVERAPLVSSIAHSLATFLQYRRGSGAHQACGTVSQRRPEEQEAQTQEEVKETLRGHVWMAMTNGLRALHSANARRLRPLTMPRPWSEENREEDVVMTRTDGIEMLDEVYALHKKSPRHSEQQVEEEEEMIWERLEDEAGCGIDDASEEELLLDDGKIDLLFLEDEFEELCFFGRGVDGDGDAEAEVEVSGEGGGMHDAGTGDELDFADHVEEMLFRGQDKC